LHFIAQQYLFIDKSGQSTTKLSTKKQWASTNTQLVTMSVQNAGNTAVSTLVTLFNG